MRDMAWPGSDLAPFGGITRIRFKGFVQDVSANSGSPALRPQRKTRWGEVNDPIGATVGSASANYSNIVRGAEDPPSAVIDRRYKNSSC
jgi:hypothetical protein